MFMKFYVFLAWVYLLVISYDDAVCYNFRLDQLVSRDLFVGYIWV